MTLIVGLTGGIATGKSNIAWQLKLLGAKVFDADACVHQILENNHAIKDLFPECVVSENIDRQKLGKIVFTDDNKLKLLENILHPQVRKAEEKFIRLHQRLKTRFIVLEIPLLFETGADILCDVVITADCPPFLQKQRALRRKGMGEERFQAIIKKQMPRNERNARSDVIIPTGLGKSVSFRYIKSLISIF
jgi:dephospho-CoA kinase